MWGTEKGLGWLEGRVEVWEGIGKRVLFGLVKGFRFYLRVLGMVRWCR